MKKTQLTRLASIAMISCTLSTNSLAIGWHHGISVGLSKYQGDLTLAVQDNQGQQSRFEDELSNQSSKENLLTLVGVEGYSISRKWAVSYQINQFDLSSDNQEHVKYQALNANFDMARSLLAFNNGINAYGLLGIEYLKHELNDKNNDIKFENDKWLPYAGIRLDVPITRSFATHLKAKSDFTQDSDSQSIQIAANYRLDFHSSVMLSYEVQKIKLKRQTEQQTTELNLDNNRISLRWYFIW
ncbi:hypothetical protein [Catenovulum sediminis]|uniref:Outer membrane protein beta-barrel domain-containing protein n=1 Tax=Catenovulum sediminis TaxID=1740262 RepID=A0ABV1RHX2_9ALTE